MGLARVEIFRPISEGLPCEAPFFFELVLLLLHVILLLHLLQDSPETLVSCARLRYAPMGETPLFPK